MIGQMGSFERPSADLGDPLDLYVHGFVSSRLFNTGRDGGDKGVPVCVSASHVDGLVLAMSAFHSSYNYRSAILFGHATIVTDPEEKLYALELVTNSVVPGRWNNSRLPPLSAELSSTGVLKIKIASGSLKYRVGQCDDDKKDKEDDGIVGSIWSGVLPMHSSFGEPVPSPYNKIDMPEYIAEYTKEYSTTNQDYAQKMANEPYGG